MRLNEIEERLSAIKAELEVDGADLSALEVEINTLKEERKGIMEQAEKRKTMMEAVANLPGAEIITFFAPAVKCG